MTITAAIIYAATAAWFAWAMWRNGARSIPELVLSILWPVLVVLTILALILMWGEDFEDA